MAKVGRPRKEPVSVLSLAVDEYFGLCEGRGRFPTESGMLLHLDISEEQYRKKWEDKGYRKVLERARLRRMDWLENQMVVESRVSSGCMNALKQEKNGGYVDRASLDNKSKCLTIKLAGVGKAAGE